MTLGEQLIEKIKGMLSAYDAYISCEDHYQGYPECGEDVRMTLNIPSKYSSGGEQIQKYEELDLGRNIEGATHAK